MSKKTKKKLIKVAILTSYQREYVKYDFYFPSEQLMKKIFAEKGLELHYVSPHYYNPETKQVIESRNVKWMAWNRLNPKAGLSIFEKEPDLK